MARPDREVRHEPGCCGRCGAGLGGRPVTGVERRQVFDLPPVTSRGDRASADRAGMRLRAPHQGRGPAGRGGAGAVRAADRRDHRLPVRWAVPVQGAHRAGAGRAVRHPAVVRDGGGHHRPRRRAARRVPGARPRADRRQRRGRVRRDRVPGRGQAALGALRPHRQVHPAHGPPQARHARRWRRWASFPRFAGVAVHDAWAPYDTYTGP